MEEAAAFGACPDRQNKARVPAREIMYRVDGTSDLVEETLDHSRLARPARSASATAR
jgi:hypothetical protein